jgi:intracellular sulfur oxidation DsrE/DsrF family protein
LNSFLNDLAIGLLINVYKYLKYSVPFKVPVFVVLYFNLKTIVMTPHKPPLASSRRSFLNSIAAGAATIALPSILPTSHILAEDAKQLNPDDPEAWVAKIKGKHKIVFDATQPHGIYPFAWPRVFLMTNFATGSLEKDCCAVVVLRHTAIPYAFEHSMWEKYKFGEVFNAPDPVTNTPSVRNPFSQPASGAFTVPGIGEIKIGINELQASGVLFCVCSAAITVFSNVVAKAQNKNAEEISTDWMKAMIPGIQPVPSGVWALGRAQEKGCAYVFAG